MSDSTNVLGHSVSRIDAVAKATGAARYPGDLEIPGMLRMKILFAERPHAQSNFCRRAGLAGDPAYYYLVDELNAGEETDV
jgi:CO/xanthine dehydrogenase Mo-binding subunit